MTDSFEIQLFYNIDRISNEIIVSLFNLLHDFNWNIDMSSVYIETIQTSNQHPQITEENELILLLSSYSSHFKVNEFVPSINTQLVYDFFIAPRDDLIKERDWGPCTRFSYISILFDESTIKIMGRKKYISLLEQIALKTDCILGFFYREQLNDDIQEFLDGTSTTLKLGGISFFIKRNEIKDFKEISMNELNNKYIIKQNNIYFFGCLKRAMDDFDRNSFRSVDNLNSN